jgi:hypothetical protein
MSPADIGGRKELKRPTKRVTDSQTEQHSPGAIGQVNRQANIHSLDARSSR